MSRKFIPTSDLDFAGMAQGFAILVAKNHDALLVSAEESEYITRTVNEFRAWQAKTRSTGQKSQNATRRKNAARKEAEEVIRKYANQFRGDMRIPHLLRQSLGLGDRPAKLHKRECPQVRPMLKFLGKGDTRKISGVHILDWRGSTKPTSRAKPASAARLELFIERLPNGAAPGKKPGEGARYLRSFSSSPMKVEFPMTDEPMLVIYWGRWADATGEVGPWSQPVIAGVEGWKQTIVAGPEGGSAYGVAA